MKKPFQEVITTALSVVVTWGVSNIVKVLVHAPRPFVATGAPNTFLVDPYASFPSSHAAVFFAFATAVFIVHKPSGILCYGVALGIAIERVVIGVHYPIDVIVGACIGVGIAYVIGVYGPKLVKYLFPRKAVK
jgi:undecaprenyl-diphosphatase